MTVETVLESAALSNASLPVLPKSSFKTPFDQKYSLLFDVVSSRSAMTVLCLRGAELAMARRSGTR